MANVTGEKELKKDWPVEEGLTAKTQKQTGRISNLVPKKSIVQFEEKVGLN